MGCFYKYCCKACAYQANVCGGYDRGFEVHLVTISCSDCGDILDVPIDRDRWVAGVDLELAKQPDTQMFTCKVCKNDACPKYSGECPRCQQQMERVQFVMDWD